MSGESSSPRTRRAVLAAALGAGAATVATAIARPLPASADDNQPVLLGVHNFATLDTIIDGGATGGLSVYSVDVGALQSTSGAGNGVWGMSTSAAGVYGTSTTGFGAGGTSVSGSGVVGHTGADPVPPQPVAGVVGHADAAIDAVGVYGKAEGDTGNGVEGHGSNGVVGFGEGVGSTGVTGFSETGLGGYFYTSSPLKGTGLMVTGRVRLDQAAGIATVAKFRSSVVVTPGSRLSSTSAVVATLMTDAGATIAVQRVAVTSTSKFTIFLTGRTNKAAKVAWHVFN